MNRFYILLIVLSLFSFVSQAQEENVFNKQTGIGFVPQYTISGGLRMDIDFSISKTSSQWLIISPQVFWVTDSRYGHDFESLKGVGLDVKHKIYLKPESMDPEGFYVQYGAMAQYFSIVDTRQYGEYYEENGVTYYGISEGEIETRLLKVGGNFHLGYQWLIGQSAYLDVYSGPGIRISHNNRTEGFDTWYNDSWVDYGYSGTLLDAGFRLGFYF
jgi:hypothetical protein